MRDIFHRDQGDLASDFDPQLANAIRMLSVDAVQQANSGHPGLPMGMADVATVLFSRHLRFAAAQPEWPNRDRLVLSAGHGSMLLYSLLYLTGYPQISLDDLRNFRQLGSATAGHPEYGLLPGIEATTGVLGQGLAMAVGMAIAECKLRAEFGAEVINHHTYVICGDGCLMEGISYEAISLAGHLRLDKLIVLFDDNGISIDGSTDLTVSENILLRFEACGWHVQQIDGHNPYQIDTAIMEAKAEQSRPSLIACRTIIGFGSPTKAGTAAVHGAALGEEEVQLVRKQLGWSAPPFVIPEPIMQQWRSIGQRHAHEYEQWYSQHQSNPELGRRLRRQLPPPALANIEALATSFNTQAQRPDSIGATLPSGKATRQLSQQVLASCVDELPELMMGSADLSGSNGTYVPNKMFAFSQRDHRGNYLHYGCREHAMAALMNGLSLHGGMIAGGGTFLSFCDYLKPALRLSALMHQPVIYVFTHDSIGLGEDGPTHQPIEHLASLRAIPNLNVIRPGNAREVAESWGLALQQTAAELPHSVPTALILTRQGISNIDDDLAKLWQVAKDYGCSASSAYLTGLGGYVLSTARAQKSLDVTLIATGSELELAVLAQQRLWHEHQVNAQVVSMPCTRLFKLQPESYRTRVLGTARRIVIEAAASYGWHEFLRPDDTVIGIDSFGASGKAEDLYKHFDITADHIVNTAVRG